MAKFGVVRTDNMYGTDNRTGLVSVRYMGPDGSVATEIENGSVVKIGELMAGEREIRIGLDVAADTKIENVALIASPEVDYDERKRNLEDYINVAGKNCRGYYFHVGDTFGLTIDCFEGTPSPAVGDTVELTDGVKLNVVSEPTGATVVGKIIAVEISGRHTFYVIEVK